MKRMSASRNTQLPIYGCRWWQQPKVSGKNRRASRHHHFVFQPLATWRL